MNHPQSKKVNLIKPQDLPQITYDDNHPHSYMRGNKRYFSQEYMEQYMRENIHAMLREELLAIELREQMTDQKFEEEIEKDLVEIFAKDCRGEFKECFINLQNILEGIKSC